MLDGKYMCHRWLLATLVGAFTCLLSAVRADVSCTRVDVIGNRVYMGYLPKYNYFWNLFISPKKGLDVPLLIYIRGELGYGSIMKVYNGIGSVMISSTKRLANNSNSITSEYHLLAIDLPCGIGFTNETEPNCPPLPISNSTTGSRPSLYDLASTVADGLEQFFSTTDPNCNLKNMLSLKIFLWSEGYSSPLLLYLRKHLEAKTSIKMRVSGIILGDPMIDLLRQSQNYASYATSRSIVSSRDYRYFLNLEANMQLKTLTSASFCNLNKELFSKIDLTNTCPFYIEQSCSSQGLQTFTTSSGTINCEFFYVESLELDQDNPVLKMLMDSKLKILRYVTNTSSIFLPTSKNYIEIYNTTSVNLFSETVNSVPVLLYQSQDNLVANSISLMLFADTLRWKGYEDFIRTPTVFKILDQNDSTMRYTLRQFENYWKAQVFSVGGLYTYRRVAKLLRGSIFKLFTQYAKRPG